MLSRLHQIGISAGVTLPTNAKGWFGQNKTDKQLVTLHAEYGQYSKVSHNTETTGYLVDTQQNTYGPLMHAHRTLHAGYTTQD